MNGAAWGVLVAALAPLTMQYACAADEADIGAEPVETVVVSGFRKSLDEARLHKKDNVIASDSIVAEDMAKFPDLNLAEALQRLPGVVINREAGEGRRITLRGLGPDYTRVQLNGMEAIGNVDSAMDSRGQRSRDRAFDFTLFASELFSRVDVEKSYQVKQSEGGMAGTVGLFSARPLDYAPGFKGALSLQGGTNTYTEDFQPRGAGMIGYNWNDKFGILISLAYSKRKTQEQGYDTYGTDQFSASKLGTMVSTGGMNISNLSAANQSTLLAGDLVWADGNRLSVWDAKQTRLGVTAALQWRPIESMTLSLDLLKGRFHTDRDEYHLASRTHDTSTVLGSSYTQSGYTHVAPTINALTYDSTGFVTYVDASDTVFASEHRRQKNTNNFEQGVFTFDWAATDKLTIDGHVGAENSTYKTPIDDKIYLEAQGGLQAYYPSNGDYGYNSYDWDTTDPDNWHIREFYFRQSHQGTSFRDGVLNASYMLSDMLTLKAGYNYRRYKTFGTEEYNDAMLRPEFRDGDTVNGHDDSVDAYYKVFKEQKDHAWVVADWDKALAYYGLQHTMIDSSGNYTTDIENTFGVTEETNALYAQADWNVPVSGMSFKGNLGVRGYRSGVENRGQMTDADGNLEWDQVNTHYSGILPALNMVLAISDRLQIRASAAQNINRPSLTSMRMTGSVKEDSGKYTVSNGNPNLKPYHSNDYNLSAEYYFGDVGMLSAGLFHKDIKDLVIDETLKNVSYSVTGLSTALADGLTSTTIISEYTRPVNQSTAGLSGLEMAAQSDFFFLPAPFNHFGVVANATLISSNMVSNGLKGPITGLSNSSANGTLYYETDLWGARMSANYRSGYLRTRYDGEDPTSEDGMKSTTYVDAAAFYNLTKDMRITFDVINLTNQREVQYNSIYKRLHNATQSGTTFFVGFNLQY